MVGFFEKRIRLTGQKSSSLVIDNLCGQAGERENAVAGLYCDSLAQKEQTVTNMMGAILKQLAGRGGIPKDIREAFRRGEEGFGGGRPRPLDPMGLLRIVMSSLPQAFICIDALDACTAEHLTGLLESLRDIVREFPKTRIFLTGRPHVKEDIQRYFPKAIMMPITLKAEDIKNYIEMRLHGDAEPEAMDDNLRVDIISAILQLRPDKCVGAFGFSTRSKMYTYQ